MLTTKHLPLCAAAWTSANRNCRGIRLAGQMFPEKLPLPLWISLPPRNNVPRAKPTHHPKRHLDQLSRFCMGPKCYAIQCIVNGEENPQNCLFLSEFRHPAGGGPSHSHRQHPQKKSVEIKRVVQTDSEIHRHTNHNTHSYAIQHSLRGFTRWWIAPLLYPASGNHRGHCNTNLSTLVYLQIDHYNSQWLNSPITLYTSLT